MLVTVDTYVHNDRYACSYRPLRDDFFVGFRKLFVGFQKTKGCLWAYSSLGFVALNACVSVGYTMPADD